MRARGHDAWSCDVLATEGDPKFHIQDDVLKVLNDGWDMMIAHPPCTYLTVAGAAYYNDPGRKEKRDEAIAFFNALWTAPIDKIAIENPKPFSDLTDVVGRYHQIVNPFDFGQPVRKGIYLWLKNLPPLFSTLYTEVEPDKTYIRKTGKKAGTAYRAYYHNGRDARERSRFFKSVANAMAEQWA